MSTEEFLSKQEVYDVLIDFTEKNPQCFNLSESRLMCRAIDVLQGKPDYGEITEIVATNLLIQGITKIQREGNMTILEAKICIDIVDFCQDPTKKVKRITLNKRNQKVDELLLKIDKMQIEMDRMKDMINEMYYAPGMPGFEMGKDSFEKHITDEFASLQISI